MWKKRSLTRSKRAARKRNKARTWRAILALLSLIGIIGSVAYVSHNNFFKIERVMLEGATLTEESDIESIVFELASGTRWGIFSKQNILLYPKQEIEKRILSEYPRIIKVAARIGGMRTVSVKIIERAPIALWCGQTKRDAECYFLDNDGFIFSSAPTFTPEVYVRFFGPVSREEALRSTFLPSQFSPLYDFIEGVRVTGLTPLSVVVEENGDAILETALGDIRFSVLKPFSETLDNLTLFWKENKSNLMSFEYIDLRFGNKIFYKP